MAFNYDRHIRHGKLPHIWCPGCTYGIVFKSLLRAVETMQIPKDHLALVSGIGCASRLPGYVDWNTLHTAHGRAIPFATGLKMARPDKRVLVVSGDGDATAIGGNHFIHACRRNIDITVIVMNNFIYGMTGGQHSPTTPVGHLATTMPFGNIDPTFNIPSAKQGRQVAIADLVQGFSCRAQATWFKYAHHHTGSSLFFRATAFNNKFHRYLTCGVLLYVVEQ